MRFSHSSSIDVMFAVRAICQHIAALITITVTSATATSTQVPDLSVCSFVLPSSFLYSKRHCDHLPILMSSVVALTPSTSTTRFTTFAFDDDYIVEKTYQVYKEREATLIRTRTEATGIIKTVRKDKREMQKEMKRVEDKIAILDADLVEARRDAKCIQRVASQLRMALRHRYRFWQPAALDRLRLYNR